MLSLFFTGLGIKAVYGAFEKTIDQLVTKFNLDVVRKTPGQNALVRNYLEQRLAQFNPETHTAERKIVLQLIDELSRPSPSS